MGANDKFIKLTVLMPNDLYKLMHQVSESNLSSHNRLMLRAISKYLEKELEIVKYREQCRETWQIEDLVKRGIPRKDAERAVRETLEEQVRGIVSPEPTSPEVPTNVYLIGVESSTLVKIGVSASLEARVAAIQTYCPFRAQLLYSVEGDESLEKSLHILFKTFRRNGEWFDDREGRISAYFRDELKAKRHRRSNPASTA